MEPHELSLQTSLQALMTRAPGLWTLEACGVTRSQRSIPALVHHEAYVPTSSRARVLLLGGLSGQAADVQLVLSALESYVQAGPALGQNLALSAVPCGNPDGVLAGTAPGNGAGGVPESGYPPLDNFFHDPHNPERRYLWRWAGLQAPDVLLEIRAGERVTWEAAASTMTLAGPLQATLAMPPDSLVAALGANLSNGLAPNGLGPVHGLRLTTPPEALVEQLARLWQLLHRANARRISPARHVLDARRARTPLQIARSLAEVYGHTLTPVVYTQGMSISARLRLARMDPTYENPVPSIVRLVEPYVSGEVSMFKEPAAPSALAGLLWGMQLAEVTRDRRYADMVISVGERYQPGTDGGAPPPSDPTFRTEDMFMNGAMLGRAFRLSGNTSYMDLQTRFLLEANIQQADGLFWHCRTAPYYWGRGNGFALLGFSETLSFLPTDHPDSAALVQKHVRHLAALRALQQASGLYPQVLNVPGSYQEFTITCMTGFAMARALRRGWLDASYRPAIDLAWQGVKERIDDSGGLVDCCTNTGVQDSLQAYIDRPAVFGRDDRGGSMAMWFALEMEQLARTRLHS
ncbi:MAG: glycoside hydrolase family 88 protein [Candidatus Tectimicrobiota bacterium]